MKVGTVALIGRPNTGKSTLVNNLVGHKIAITSPKPQTTRFPIFGVFEDERGQIIFVDTPGIFAKLEDKSNKGVNLMAEEVLADEIDLVLYVVDHSRQRGVEENRVLGLLRKVNQPKILVINKVDIEQPSYRNQYAFLEDEFDKVVEVSALKTTNLPILLNEIFEFLEEGEKITAREELPVPALNLNSNLYIEEIIREKVFLVLRDELPYAVHIALDEVTERSNGTTYIRARIITREPRYKKMIIGTGGKRIREIGMMVRKEIEVSSGRKAFIELAVEVE